MRRAHTSLGPRRNLASLPTRRGFTSAATANVLIERGRMPKLAVLDSPEMPLLKTVHLLEFVGGGVHGDGNLLDGVRKVREMTVEQLV